MKRAIIIIIAVPITMIAAIFLFLGSAVAQTEEPTWEPIFKTPTPKPTDDYTCYDEGMPGGWGEVTPDVWWMINCGNCLLTQTPQGGTATPIITPEPSGTPTSGDAWELYCYQVQLGTSPAIDCSSIHGKNIQIEVENHSIAGPQILVWVKLKCIDGYTCTNANDVIYEKTDFAGVYHMTYQAGSGWTWSGTVERWNTSEGLYKNCPWTLTCDYEYHSDRTYEVYKDGAGYYYTWAITHFSNYGVTDSDEHLIINLGFDPIAPIPTYTPAPGNGYCENLPGEGGGGGDDWGLPVPRVGPGTCASIPSWELDLSGWPVVGDLIGDFIFPGFAICFEPIEFGEVTLFGLSFSLDILALAMAGIVAFRILQRIIA